MKFLAFNLQREEVPATWLLPNGVLKPATRARAIISAEDSEGHWHKAELAPYPGVHPESLQEALKIWNQLIVPWLLREAIDFKLWQWNRPWFGLLSQEFCRLSSVQTAVEQLLLSAAQFMGTDIVKPMPAVQIPGSALLALPEKTHEDYWWRDFIALWQLGFRSYKCKIGRHAPLQELEMLLRMQAHGQGELKLRLDANQKLNFLDQSEWQISALKPSIDYWEEPGKALSSELWPQALDESLWDRVAGEAPSLADIWILKPNRLSLSGLVGWLQQAKIQGKRAVLSNVFESGLSLRCYTWLYAQFTPQFEALGFGTAYYQPNDLWESRSWANPLVEVPAWPFAGL